MTAHVAFNPVHRYDQAGLMVRVSPTCWLKTSVEHEPGERLQDPGPEEEPREDRPAARGAEPDVARAPRGERGHREREGDREAEVEAGDVARFRRVAGGDVYYSPLVKNPTGGDTLALYFEFDEDEMNPRTRSEERVSRLFRTDGAQTVEIPAAGPGDVLEWNAREWPTGVAATFESSGCPTSFVSALVASSCACVPRRSGEK